jgi:hypothetical protein
VAKCVKNQRKVGVTELAGAFAVNAANRSDHLKNHREVVHLEVGAELPQP